MRTSAEMPTGGRIRNCKLSHSCRDDGESRYHQTGGPSFVAMYVGDDGYIIESPAYTAVCNTLQDIEQLYVPRTLVDEAVST